MRRNIWITMGIVAAALGPAFMAAMPAPDPEHEDLTLMHPAVTIVRDGGGLHVHGAWRVHRPAGTGRDHDVAIRLVVSGPGGEVVSSQDLSRINYHRDHGEAAYPIHEDIDLDATGLDVAVIAVDRESGREFASFTSHGGDIPPVEPGPGIAGER